MDYRAYLKDMPRDLKAYFDKMEEIEKECDTSRVEKPYGILKNIMKELEKTQANDPKFQELKTDFESMKKVEPFYKAAKTLKIKEYTALIYKLFSDSKLERDRGHHYLTLCLMGTSNLIEAIKDYGGREAFLNEEKNSPEEEKALNEFWDKCEDFIAAFEKQFLQGNTINELVELAKTKSGLVFNSRTGKA